MPMASSYVGGGCDGTAEDDMIATMDKQTSVWGGG